MTIGAARENRAARTAVGRIDVPAQTAPAEDGVGRVNGGHELHGLWLEHADAVEFALVQHHPTEAREIVRRGENSGVTGHTAHAARRGIVNDPAQHAVGRLLRGRDARELAGWREIAGVPHPQRRVDLGGDEFVKLALADALHDLAQQDEVDVAVTNDDAGRVGRLLHAGQREASLVAAPRRRGRQARPKAGRVREQMAHGNAGGAFTLELRDVRPHGVGQLDLSAFDEQQHRGRGGDDFGERGGVEDGVFVHRFDCWDERSFAEGLVVAEALTFEPQDGAGNVFLRDGVGNGGVHLGQARGFEGGRSGEMIRGEEEQRNGENDSCAQGEVHG